MKISFTSVYLLVVLCFANHGIVIGQTESDFEKEWARFQNSIAEDQTAELKSLGDPRLTNFIAIAERASKRIFTPENNELRKMAREFDQKLIPLQTSDFGRWIGTQPNSVATFIKLDTEIVDLNDEALNLRRERLRSSVDALRKYQPRTQGAFDPAKSEPVLAILQDAIWVEVQYRKLTSRLALIGDLETRFPRDQDWTGLPTLRERKQEQIARMFERIKSAEHKARQRASEETAVRIEESVFEREVQKTETQIAGEEALAKFGRDLMEAEFGRQLSEIDKRIMATELKTEKIKSEIVNMRADASKNQLEEYLTSDRVRSLLSPFVSDGFVSPGFSGNKRGNEITAGPMSLERIVAFNCLIANHKSMDRLFRIVNSGNDRPGWGANASTYSQAPNDFQNMKGNFVNRYIEAQRILREHGGTLVQLELLRQ